ncbi:piggyBac transposable element-derived protein 4-like [Saccostrea cucullata]|uniref:piggyBac transposable element-derived protein 4-like n=1 Tax=Saccostrea cuccullata TaxID=36930 RepID=UPI002ED474A3
MQAYIGILIMMGINKIPDYKLYWSHNKFLRNAGFQEVMPLKRYEKITQYLHCSAEDMEDTLYKIRPILDIVSKNMSESYNPRKQQTIDEGMIAYKGRHKAKQYIPSKPTKWGLKVWLRCDSLSGFCHQLDLYLGRDQYKGVPVGQTVVFKLTEELKGKNHHVFFDSFFTSVELAKGLLARKIFCCGTIVRNRKGFPSDLKSVTPKFQGDYVTRQDGQLTATVWMDNRPVSVLSTMTSPLEMATNVSRRLKDGTAVSVPRPQSIGYYQSYFRGVDLFDQLRSKYPVGRASKKWWKYVLHFLINTAIINAYILMKESRPQLPKKKYRQLDFRISLAQNLIGSFRTPLRAAGRRTLNTPTCHSFSKLVKKRSYCKQCSKSTPRKRKDTAYGCSLCDTHLCGKQCFSLFHGFLSIEE